MAYAEVQAAGAAMTRFVEVGAPTPTEPPVEPRSAFVTVSFGARGWFAVLMWWNPDLDGSWEPWEAHPDFFSTEADVVPIARAWAQSQGVDLL